MDIVILTGAGAEPAQSIARRLVANGARVYGLANKLPEKGFSHRDFIPVGVNPADPAAVRDAVESIVKREGAVGAVILAGHNPVEDAFESAHPNDVALAVFAGVAAPLAAVRAALPGLIRRRGLVLAITRPVFGPGAALGGVVEAAMAAFCDGLFGELRDTGVRVSHIRIQENPGTGDPAARFTHAPQSRVQPDIVADTVEAVMRLRENNAITRLVLRPQATREEPRIPVTAEPKLASLQIVQLPTSENYPAPEEKILTPRYRRPDYAPPPEDKEIEEDDDSDDSVDPELAYLIRPAHRSRIVRDEAPSPAKELGRWADANESAGDESSDGSDDEAAAAGDEPRQAPAQRRAPEPVREQRPQSPARPPKNGAVRIQPPNTGGEPAAPRVDLHPGYRAKQEESRNRAADPHAQQQQSGRPPRPFEQLPRPPGWQGPRLPQPQNNQQPRNPNGDRQHQQPRPEREHRFRGNRDQFPSDNAGTSPEEATGAANPSQDKMPLEVKSEPANGESVSAADTQVVAPKPVVIPVIVPHEASPESGDKPATTGRSEAVRIDFSKTTTKPTEAEPTVATVEESDAAPSSEEKPKRKPATKKAAVKTTKSKPAEPVTGSETPESNPAPDSSEPVASKPPVKRGRPRKS